MFLARGDMGTRNKATIYFLIGAVFVAGIAGLMWLLLNKPSADIPTPPIPPEPTSAQVSRPPVPNEPRLAGDSNDDGLVDALDINAVVIFWKQITRDYNLVDAKSDTPYMITALDLNMIITYWKCLEQKGIIKCPYIKVRVVDSPNPVATSTVEPCVAGGPCPPLPPIPPIPPIPTDS